MSLSKKLISGLALLASVASLGNTVVLADDISLQGIGYGGNGCPQGSASVTLSPDAKSLSIIFDSFVAAAGGVTGRSMDRKNCNIAVGVHIPNGLSISLIDVDYRGYNSLPRGASSTFTTEYFFAGSIGPKFQRNFIGALDQDYLINNQLAVQGQVWSPCGADVNLRINTSIVARTNNLRQDTMSTLDSTDMRASLLYRLQTRICR